MKQRIYFTSAERETIAKEFRKEIWRQKVPGKLDIINFMQKNAYFTKYSWTKVKYAVHNMIIARKRKGSQLVVALCKISQVHWHRSNTLECL